MKTTSHLLPFVLLLHFSLATYSPVDREYWDEIGERNLQKQLERFRKLTETEKRPKNIILFIGDGMGITAVTAARILWAEQAGKPGRYAENPFFMESFEASGWSKTSSLDHHVTDSAAGAVALLSGRKVEQDTVNRLPRKPRNCSQWESSGMIKETIPYQMLERGGNAGIVTNTRITHATPATTYAQGILRHFETDDKILPKSCKGKDIAAQLLNYPANKFKVLMGGGSGHLYSNRTDRRNLMEEWSSLGGNRRVVRSREELARLKVEEDTHLMGIFGGEHMSLKRELIKNGNQPHLANMTEKAIEVMQKKNDNGYFLVIEGGQIDLAEHWSQMRRASEELFELDEAIKRARDLTDPLETLIIVTADHSHPVGLPGYRLKNESLYGGTSPFDDNYKAPGVVFVAGLKNNNYNYDAKDANKTQFESPSLVRRQYGLHGAEDVPIYATGPYSWLFTGSMQNTEVSYRMKYLLCLLENHKCPQEKKRKKRDTSYIYESIQNVISKFF